MCQLVDNVWEEAITGYAHLENAIASASSMAPNVLSLSTEVGRNGVTQFTALGHSSILARRTSMASRLQVGLPRRNSISEHPHVTFQLSVIEFIYNALVAATMTAIFDPQLATQNLPAHGFCLMRLSSNKGLNEIQGEVGFNSN
jgi:hypothetical protein